MEWWTGNGTGGWDLGDERGARAVAACRLLGAAGPCRGRGWLGLHQPRRARDGCRLRTRPTLTIDPPAAAGDGCQDIKSRAAHKQAVLDDADEARRAANSTRRVERELFNSLRRDKVDSIQKMQARGSASFRGSQHSGGGGGGRGGGGSGRGDGCQGAAARVPLPSAVLPSSSPVVFNDPGGSHSAHRRQRLPRTRARRKQRARAAADQRLARAPCAGRRRTSPG